MACDYCALKFLRCSVDGKHYLMRVQSETPGIGISSGIVGGGPEASILYIRIVEIVCGCKMELFLF